jgi:hypothetical protein
MGGLGLGTTFSSILVHLTSAATPRYAADISGVFTTSLQIAGAVGVAAFGSLYLSRITGPGRLPASAAFGVVTAAFALAALAAGATAYRATRPAPPGERTEPRGARDRAGRPPTGPPPGATRPALREASPRRHR